MVSSGGSAVPLLQLDEARRRSARAGRAPRSPLFGRFMDDLPPRKTVLSIIIFKCVKGCNGRTSDADIPRYSKEGDRKKWLPALREYLANFITSPTGYLVAQLRAVVCPAMEACA